MGSVWAAYIKIESLVVEKKILFRQVRTFDETKAKLGSLVAVLQSEMEEKSGNIRHKSIRGYNSRKKVPGILRFRKGVIAVLAVNRFHQGCLSNCKMFTAKEWPTGTQKNASVVCGNVVANEGRFRGKV